MTSDQEKDVWEAVEDSSHHEMPWALQVMEGPSLLSTIRLEPDVTYIGRMPENHVVVDDDQASRSHARILFEKGQFRLEDQESQNGTFLNGTKVKEKVLALGDIIRIGKIALQVIEATASVKGAVRESHLEMSKEEEEEWRLDSTVSMASEDLQRKVLERIQAKRAEKAAKETAQAPELSFTLTFGSKTIEKQIRFKKGKKRPEGDTQPESMAVHIRVGKWILEDEIPLD